MNKPLDKRSIQVSTVSGEVAIIGMACVFPGAPNLQTYWENILLGKDAVINVPKGRWDADIHFCKEGDDINKVYCRRGGYLDEYMLFDPAQYGVMPVAVEGGEPDQFLVLKVVHEALRDAGYLNKELEPAGTEFILGRGNYLGVGASNLIQRSIVTEQTLMILKNLHPEYTSKELMEIRQELLNSLPKLSAETAASYIPNLTTGRSANRLNFMGPNYTVDAACASSLIAVDIGVRDLLTGRCDLAIVGGIHILASVPFLLIFCAFQAMSRRSQIRPFDQDADGTLPGEGIGVVILKRKEEAEQDGDRIYAVIKGIGTSSDGRAVSVVAPRVEGEELALRRAYQMADISPTSVRLIEAHGVGTTVGDVIEVEALRRVFGPRDGDVHRCALGSVKSMIGHAMPAAGIASLIKTALAVYHKVLPPTIHCERVNPKLELEKTPFYINTITRPWIHGDMAFPRRAGVNAFGFGGINAHVILEEYKGKNGDIYQFSAPKTWETEVFILHGEDRPALIQQARELEKFLSHHISTENRQISLKDLAYSLNTKLKGHSYRLAIVASDINDLREKLAYSLQRLLETSCRQIKDLKGIYFFENPLKGKLVFMFPGEGAQYLNMLADLCMFFPEVRSCFDKADRILLQQGQSDLPSFYIFPPPSFSEEERLTAEKHLWRMDRATEAVLIGNLAMYTLLKNLGLQPDQMVGHSAGEWSAMIFSGIIDTEEFLQHTRKLNQIYRRLSEEPDIPKATLLAVGTSRDQITSLIEPIKGTIYIANDNCPHQVVIIGEEKSAEEAVKYLRDKGIAYEKLPFDRGYHTPLFTPICPHLQEYFSSFNILSPHTEVYSCSTGAPYPQEPEKILKLAVETWVLPVAFRQTIENMYEAGARVFVEVGPRGNLTAFVEDILRGKQHLAIASNVARRSGITQLNHTVGLLSAQGISLNLGYLYQYRSPSQIFLTDGQQISEAKERGISVPLGWYALKVSPREAKGKAVTEDVSLSSSPGSSNGGADHKLDQNLWPMSGLISNLIANEFPLEGVKNISPTVRSMSPEFPSPPTPPSSSVMGQYFQTMESFLDIQREMMNAYLESNPNLLTEEIIPGQLPEPDQEPHDLIVLPEPIPEQAHSEGLPVKSTNKVYSTEVKAVDLAKVLIELVSEKTGYPPEMIGLDLDMEGDLGIDSIKRVEIIGSFRERFNWVNESEIEAVSAFKTLQQVIDFFNKKLEPEPKTGLKSERIGSTSRNLPFIGEIIEIEPEKSVVLRRTIDTVEDLFLADHRFGQRLSEQDHSLGALPVIPMTISIEIMAEAASLLFPGQRLVAVKDVSASQWLCLRAERPIILRIKAEAVSGHEARVQIHRLDQDDTQLGEGKVVISGRAIFSHGYPIAPPAMDFILKEEHVPSHTAAEVYSQHRMFHGPRFQGIVSMDKIGNNGLYAKLQALPRGELFRSSPDPDFLTDPFLLDAAGQLVGYWPVEYLETGFVIFPIALEGLYIYKTPPEPFRLLNTRMQLRRVSGTRVLADLDLLGQDGQVVMRLVGWEDWRFYWSRQLYDFWRFPNQGIIGQVFNLDLPEGMNQGEGTVTTCFIRPFWRGFGDIFQDVMAYMVLSREERKIYQEIPSIKKQQEWLLKKMAAKDASHCWLKKKYGVDAYPADLMVRITASPSISIEDGTHQVEWVGKVEYSELPLVVTVANEGIAVAVAIEKKSRIGMSIKSPGNFLEDMEKEEGLGLWPEEEALLGDMDKGEQQEWGIRLCCSKEAVARALGLNPNHPEGIMVCGFDHKTGVVRLEIEEELKSLNHGSNQVQAYSLRGDDYIVAVTIF